MNPAPESLISTSRSKSKIDFYKEYILFQLEQDHTPRKPLYEEMDRVVLKKMGKGWWIGFGFTLVFTGVSFYLYFFDSASIYHVITAFLLLLMLVASYAERHNKLIQIKKGSLTIDVFRSTKARELEWVLDRLHDRTNKDTKV
ncbi:hypothetical protein OAQ04_03270 [Flavobacteriaceae bacterium]|nr:hypothetical protein [Flavobacteriaceae bacterium]